MNSGNNLFETFLSDDMDIYNDTDTQYTELQNSNSLDIQYDIHLPLNNLVDDINQEECVLENNCAVVSFEEKNKLKELQDGWKLGYLIQTCLGKL